MADSTTYLTELEGKNAASVERLRAGFVELIDKEQLAVTDLLQLDLRAAIEAIEVAALWVADCDDLDLKVRLASLCGERARHYDLLVGRLGALGLSLGGHDIRQGGYSKVFAFLRSLQSTEERAASAGLMLSWLDMTRGTTLAERFDGLGDSESARFYRDVLVEDARRRLEWARGLLVAVAVNEEIQARARRAAYRTVELLTEIQDPANFRKLVRFLKRAGT